MRDERQVLVQDAAANLEVSFRTRIHFCFPLSVAPVAWQTYCRALDLSIRRLETAKITYSNWTHKRCRSFRDLTLGGRRDTSTTNLEI